MIRVEEGCDIREEMFYRLAQNRLPILELHVTTKSLEDIFLELTASEKIPKSRRKRMRQKQERQNLKRRKERTPWK